MGGLCGLAHTTEMIGPRFPRPPTDHAWQAKKSPAQGRAEEHLQWVRLKVLRRKPSVYVLPDLILGYAVALLDLAFEFLTAAIDGS